MTSCMQVCEYGIDRKVSCDAFFGAETGTRIRDCVPQLVQGHSCWLALQSPQSTACQWMHFVMQQLASMQMFLYLSASAQDHESRSGTLISLIAIVEHRMQGCEVTIVLYRKSPDGLRTV